MLQKLQIILVLATLVLACCPARAASLVQTIAAVKPSVVGVGGYLKTRSPAVRFVGTGFATGDGRDIITNDHVSASLGLPGQGEVLGIVIARGAGFEFRTARLVARDPEHDLSHLRIEGAPLPALVLGEKGLLEEGSELAFTGFPLGMGLGLHHATHRALLAAVTPILLPSLTASRLDARAITQLQRPPFSIYQLDAIAYPGNSGSPVYEQAGGTVVAVINMGLVKGLKDSAISSPTGITYAVPVVHVRELLQRKP